jgi:hypothetical protein
MISTSRIIPQAAKVTHRQTKPLWEIRWHDGKRISDMDLQKKAIDEDIVRRIHQVIVQLTKSAR